MVLEKIQKENDIKELNSEELTLLAKEVRQFLIEKISKTGGHLASNLGVVELTIALHRVFSLPEDKIIWDVGHQSYTHKILTGRKDGFDDLRKYGGMSGFPKRKESCCDAFNTGHSSTSVSAGLGYAKARDLQQEKFSVISVIGDGSLTGGMAYEALNNAAHVGSNFIIILNDNNMSISENVGGMSRYLGGLRTAKAYNGIKSGVEKTLGYIPFAGEKLIKQLKKTKSSIKQLVVPGMLFENMGITYLGPVDGHNIKELCRVLREAKKMNHAVLVHAITEKGRGYEPAEKNPSKFHGTGPFEIETGMPLKEKVKPDYTDIFGKVMYDLAAKDKKLVAITAAMSDGTGLTPFRRRYPDRFFDVGIAEEHAVTFAAGLAAGGMKPVFAVYSSFLQRAYDQMIHDVCLQNLPVVFAIDRAGLVGNDGETHQGIFDLSYLCSIPNMTVLSPKNRYELADMLRYATDFGKPIAIRYPRGCAYDGYREFQAPIVYGKSEKIFEEDGIAVVAAGHMFETAVKIRDILKETGYNCSLINARFIKPFDEEMIREIGMEHELVVVIEENVRSGGLGEHIAAFMKQENLKASFLSVAIADEYVEHGNVEVLRTETKLAPEIAARTIMMTYIGAQEGQ